MATLVVLENRGGVLRPVIEQGMVGGREVLLAACGVTVVGPGDVHGVLRRLRELGYAVLVVEEEPPVRLGQGDYEKPVLRYRYLEEFMT